MKPIILIALVILMGIWGKLTVSAEPLRPAAESRRANPVLTLTHDDKGKTITLARGEEFAIQLEENPTTGYSWAFDGTSDILALVQSDYAPASHALGSGGKRIFLLRALTHGTASLQLKHWREWEGNSSVVDTFSATILVESR